MKNPYDPNWYKYTHDSYPTSIEEFTNKESIIVDEGFLLPDADGSRSASKYNNAVINNTFSETAVRESLKDIYLNSSHKLISNNSDNVHFHKWEGYMSDMNCTINTNICEFRLPWDMFIYPEDRDVFKLSQFYRKWIKIEDILNNWNVFKWHMLVFIDRKIFSEYELYIQDQEVILRFTYLDLWLDKNYPIYIYKFDTNFQKRLLVSRELLDKQWDWKMPFSYIGDDRIMNSDKVIVAFNKISDPEIRKDGKIRVEVLGDNLEFLDVDPTLGYLDVSTIGPINVEYIMSEYDEYIWMSVFTPKFMHEYPKLLPTDVLYRPYGPVPRPVKALQQNIPTNVKSANDQSISETKVSQVFIDEHDMYGKSYDGWANIIRPIILSDAYINSIEPYEVYQEEIDNFKRSITIFSETVEDFKYYVLNERNKTEESFHKWIDLLRYHALDLYEKQAYFFDRRVCPRDENIEVMYQNILDDSEVIRENGYENIWIPLRFYSTCESYVQSTYALADKYYVGDIIKSIYRKMLWTYPNEYEGKVRFQRPIDKEDFWCFQYDQEDGVWRPRARNIRHSFPDVYFIEPLDGEILEPNLIFKAFFFYSDTPNTRDLSRDVIEPSPSYDEQLLAYQDPHGAFYDIFIEKFYWMAIKSIYSGLLITDTKWEILEYITDNPSYKRFNELFIRTMDPSFKLGLATYLKGSNAEFPFDDAIDKFQEAITLEWNNYNKISNFETYLNKQWIPSYYDYILKVLDDMDLSNRLHRRPPLTFDIRKVYNVLAKMYDLIYNASSNHINQLSELSSIITSDTSYNLDIDLFAQFTSVFNSVIDDIMYILEYIKDLDLEIYPLDSLVVIRDKLDSYENMVNKLEVLFLDFTSDILSHSIYEKKYNIITSSKSIISNENLPVNIEDVDALASLIDISSLMEYINDFDEYTHDDTKTNTIMWQINQFNSPWSDSVKDARNALFVTSSLLNGLFSKNKFHSTDDINSIIDATETLAINLIELRSSIINFWDNAGVSVDTSLIEYIDNAEISMTNFYNSLMSYKSKRDSLIQDICIIDSLDQLDKNLFSDSEKIYFDKITNSINNIINELSYLDGKPHVNEANDNRLLAIDGINEWIEYIDYEKYVFNILHSIILQSSEPSDSNKDYLSVMKSYVDTINALSLHMTTLFEEYIPDEGHPTYSDVYEVSEIVIKNPGLSYNLGDTIYIPNIGVYNVSSLDNQINSITAISDKSFYRKSFRDPSMSGKSYSSISNSLGIGCEIDVITSNHYHIIDDTAATSIMHYILNTADTVVTYSKLPNPYNNEEFGKLLHDTIPTICNRWNNLINAFSEYMTKDIKDGIYKTLDVLNEIVPIGDIFINSRSKIAVNDLIFEFGSLITTFSAYATELLWSDYRIPILNQDALNVYSLTNNFYGRGSEWKDRDKLGDILVSIADIVYRYDEIALDQDESDERFSILDKVSLIKNIISDINDGLEETLYYQKDITLLSDKVKSELSYIDPDRDVWYIIYEIFIADSGNGFQIGDIVSIRDDILLQVTSIDNGNVTSVKPFMNYALPDLLWGYHECNVLTGSGSDLSIDIHSREIKISDSMLLVADDYYIPNNNQFDETDMFLFKFENIYDLDMNYEVFIGGNQITDFQQRHEYSGNHLNANKLDVLYINANLINNLKNSSLYIPAEQYFLYKIDDIEIKDPGAGFHTNQEIFLDADEYCLRLMVAKLIYEPYKGIAEIDILSDKSIYEKKDPAGKNFITVNDTQNNIDDEFHVSNYDIIPATGNIKPATISYPDIKMIEMRYDNTIYENDDRNATFMYPSIKMDSVIKGNSDYYSISTFDASIDMSNSYNIGDPDHGWFLGDRIDNSQIPMSDDIRYGIVDVEDITHPFIEDYKRIPPNQPVRGEYHLIKRLHIHNSNVLEAADIEVPDFKSLPLSTGYWPDGTLGKTVSVENDETKEGHRCIYTILGITSTGIFRYDSGKISDIRWNTISVDWMNADWYPGFPSISQQYPSAPWMTSPTFMRIENGINNNEYENVLNPTHINYTTYIHNMTIDDISIFNWTDKRWEDLSDTNRWKLDVINNPDTNNWGFKLTFIEDGEYSYDMKLYIHKTPDTQSRARDLVRPAILDVITRIVGEINIPTSNINVNTSRTVRIRKLFPYEQSESALIKYGTNAPNGYLPTQTMDFINEYYVLDGFNTNLDTLSSLGGRVDFNITLKSETVTGIDFTIKQYIHYRNELHLADIKIFNKTKQCFENITDTSKFEVWFKDEKRRDSGYETINIVNGITIISNSEGYTNGKCWGYNEDNNLQIFGNIKVSDDDKGNIVSFEFEYMPNMPSTGEYIFDIYQTSYQDKSYVAKILLSFDTEVVEIKPDGYIHNITNPMAPLTEEFKILCKHDINDEVEYDIMISMTTRKWLFMENQWKVLPKFHIPDYHIHYERLYVLINNKRFPIVNCSTGLPTLEVTESSNGTDVQFMNLYKQYEHLEIRSLPYPVRSVYTQRNIPKNGFIDLAGKLNKPLSKNYYEFWVNGKLLYDEVTIISPTKIFLHGLTSLKNLEILEINRDNIEYFSESFLEVESSDNHANPYWNYMTYLDGVLDGNLNSDNYTIDEQEKLLAPVWEQVSRNHPDYKDYPENVDTDRDILLRIYDPEDLPLEGMDDIYHEYMIVDIPTVNGVPIRGKGLTWEQLKWRPIELQTVIDMLNEEWEEEISTDPYLNYHTIIDDDEWYGTTVRMYDKYGLVTDNLVEAFYKIFDKNILNINPNTNKVNIIYATEKVIDLDS